MIYSEIKMAFASPTVVNLSTGLSPTTSSVCSTFTSGYARIAPTRRSNTRSTQVYSTPQMIFGKSIKQTLEFSGNYTTLLSLASAAGVDLDVSNCTLFAPNNDAFSRLRPGYIDWLLENPEQAKAVLLRHVLPDQVLTTKQIKGCGFWESIPGGPLAYEGLGAIVRVGNARVINESSNNECDNGTIHTIDTILIAPNVKYPSVEQYYEPSVKMGGDSTVESVYPVLQRGYEQKRAVGATLPSTTGGRKAMGLISQLPFWMYGPPFNAAKQEDYEPISIAQPDVSSVDYQVLPPGSVIVTPDEVSAAKLSPVSGMSKYIGQTKRLVEGDGQSDYSRLDD